MTGCRNSLATKANVVARTMAYAIWTRMSACIYRGWELGWRRRGVKGTMKRIPIPVSDMSIDSPESTYDRRAFMAYFGALGLGSTLLPGVLWAQANQQPQGTP